MSKDSDEEDNEGARQRREQLTALKEAAYDLLGKAWPKDPDTQGTRFHLNEVANLGLEFILDFGLI